MTMLDEQNSTMYNKKNKTKAELSRTQKRFHSSNKTRQNAKLTDVDAVEVDVLEGGWKRQGSPSGGY